MDRGGGKEGERRREGRSDRPRLAANITSPLGAITTTTNPPFLPLYRPVSAVQLLLACHSVSLPVQPFVSVGLSGAALLLLAFCHPVNLLFSEYAHLSSVNSFVPCPPPSLSHS